MAKRNRLAIIIAVLIFLGVAIISYPFAAKWWNARRASKNIAAYETGVAQMEEKDFSSLREDAQRFNEKLRTIRGYELSEEMEAEYDSLLDVSGLGIMGYIEIPKISVSLPMYHGTDAGVLQVGIGHLEWSSLPVGGESTHSILSGHRGLADAKLFTDLPDLIVGDRFMLHVLDEVLTYEVDQIQTVLPKELESLTVEEGQDYCTLVTCTPYGINTHRLLIRGHRVTTDNNDRPMTVVPPDATQVAPRNTALVMGVLLLAVTLGLASLIARLGRIKRRSQFL